MKQLTRVCILLMISCSAAHAQTDSLLAQLARKMEHAKAYTLAIAAQMPDSGYQYKPVADEMSFGAQLVHIASNITWLSSAYLLEEKNPFAPVNADTLSKAAILELVGKAYDYGIRAIRSLSPSRLDEPVKFFAGPLTRRQILLLQQDHQTHHRGQLIVYLRLNGIKPVGYVGW